MYQRSLTCDLDWPQYSSISDKELNFPLAFVITAYMDIRNLGEILEVSFYLREGVLEGVLEVILLQSSSWPQSSGLTTATVSIWTAGLTGPFCR